jgi:hypothetical protein
MYDRSNLELLINWGGIKHDPLPKIQNPLPNYMKTTQDLGRKIKIAVIDATAVFLEKLY